MLVGVRVSYLNELSAACSASVAETYFVQSDVIMVRVLHMWFFRQSNVRIFLSSQQFLESPRFESLVDSKDNYHQDECPCRTDYHHQDIAVPLG